VREERRVDAGLGAREVVELTSFPHSSLPQERFTRLPSFFLSHESSL